ncbi:MAG: hypothetical protein ACLQDV_07655 [Candidatus Binataceae bacterium]
MRKYQIISTDGHMEIPVNFRDRMPSRFKDLVPRLVRNPDGTDTWVMDKWRRDNIGNLYCGLRYDQWHKPTAASYFYPDGSPRPGNGCPQQRLREQDQDGIDAEVLFYPIFGPGLMRLMLTRDRDCYLTIVAAYNDFLAEYCSVAPDRLIGSALVPESGVEDAIKEIERVRKLGLICASLTMWPNGRPDPAPEIDDRFWAAALDFGGDGQANSQARFVGSSH